MEISIGFELLSETEQMSIEGGVKWYWYLISPAGAILVDLYRLGYSNGYNSTRK